MTYVTTFHYEIRCHHHFICHSRQPSLFNVRRSSIKCDIGVPMVLGFPTKSYLRSRYLRKPYSFCVVHLGREVECDACSPRAFTCSSRRSQHSYTNALKCLRHVW